MRPPPVTDWRDAFSLLAEIRAHVREESKGLKHVGSHKKAVPEIVPGICEVCAKGRVLWCFFYFVSCKTDRGYFSVAEVTAASSNQRPRALKPEASSGNIYLRRPRSTGSLDWCMLHCSGTPCRLQCLREIVSLSPVAGKSERATLN